MSLSNLDLDLLRAFATVAETGNMTSAGERLRRSQSAVSLQIKRLEDQLELRLFDRSPRSVRLTAAGERLLTHACAMLAMNDAILDELAEPALEGAVRLGTPEDFATTHLPTVLARFAESHPRVHLEVDCDLTLNLLDRFGAGEFDLVLVKREPSGGESGVRVWREPLVWAASPRFDPAQPGQLPLVVSPSPCVYRARAIGALDRAGRPWRIAYTCGSLAGSQAAVRAGLGVTVLPRDMVPADLAAIDDPVELPDLHDTEIALLAARLLSAPAQRLRQHIVRALERRI
ncbi:MAG: LysR substrate-binding domain-containing protein [Sphingomonadaceae bacterium]|nr:LysR substrate-binding domain-containing protein [Sphingomonadaceae bacterium]